jgi:hypothetical protein
MADSNRRAGVSVGIQWAMQTDEHKREPIRRCWNQKAYTLWSILVVRIFQRVHP